MTTVLRPPLSIESSPTWLPEMRNARHWKYYDIPLFSSPMIERIKEFDARVAGKWVAHACPCAISVEAGVWSVGQWRDAVTTPRQAPLVLPTRQDAGDRRVSVSTALSGFLLSSVPKRKLKRITDGSDSDHRLSLPPDCYSPPMG